MCHISDMSQSTKPQLYLPEGQPHIELLGPEGTVLAELHDHQTRRDVEAGKINLSKSQLTRIVWEFWREGQQRSYHGRPAEVDLGEISD